MDATGRGGFNAPFPRMNIPENNLPNFNMAFPRPMMPLSFPTYNRSTFQNQVYFANNPPEVQGSSFWMGPFEQGEPGPQTFVNQNAAAPHEAPPVVKRKPPRRRPPKKTKAAKTLQSLRAISQKLGIDLTGAVKNPLKPIPTVDSQPQNPGVTGAVKNPPKPIPTVDSQPQNPGGSATNPQQPIPTLSSQPQNPGAKNPQQPILPSISQPADEGIPQEQTGTLNGDLKRYWESGETADADAPTPPNKKAETEKVEPPEQRPNFKWRGNVRTMFSCRLCQYITPGEVAIQRHLISYQHKEILKHLSSYFPKDRVEFLNEYVTFRTKQKSMEKNRKNLPQINDTFNGIGPEHYIHRIQAAYCQICDEVIPEDTNHVLLHIRSGDHSRKRKAAFKETKVSSVKAARDLLKETDALQRLKLYNIGRNPFRDTAVNPPPGTPGHPSQVSSTDDVLVAEEDDDDDDDNSDMCCDSNDEDTTADGGAIIIEVPDHHNECPVNEIKDSGSKVVLPIGPETSSITITEDTVREEEIEEEEEEAAEAP